MITVMGATGNTGKVIAEKLLAQGEKVRVIGRNKDKLEDLVAKGAEAAVGDVKDAAFLATAFKGADAVYTLIPPDMGAKDVRAHQDAIGVATAKAIQEAGVRKVVLLSSIGADQPTGTGPIAGLHAQENRLRELKGVDVLFLRPTLFMENFFGNLGMIKHQGINGGAIAGDLKVTMIATQDIADAAASALKARDFKGVTVRELHGVRDYTHAEATTLIGKKIGKPDLKYVQFPYGDFAKALTGFGLSQSVADGYAEMAKAFNEGKIKPLSPRGPATTTPTSFESFADVLAGAYAAA